jgi:hypothetical protein
MDTAELGRRWAETLESAWLKGDADSFLALYADDAPFRSLGREPESAHEHMRRSLTLGGGAESAWVGRPAVRGEWAAVEWWAVIADRTFAGTAWIRFGDDGLVVEEHDCWQSADGTREPWPGWRG